MVVQRLKLPGHIVSGTGIKPDPDNIAVIVNLSLPNNKTEARRVHWYGELLMEFSSKLVGLCDPIYKLSSSKAEWYRPETAFESV